MSALAVALSGLAAVLGLYVAITVRRLDREVRGVLEQIVIHAEFRP